MFVIDFLSQINILLFNCSGASNTLGDMSAELVPPRECVDTLAPSGRPNEGVRRSTRPRVQRKVFNARMDGKTHEWGACGDV